MHHFHTLPSPTPTDYGLHGLPVLGQLDSSYNLDLIATIEACSTMLDAHGISRPSLFHLLSCGHIVAVDETDRRCGRNCHHATEQAAAHAPRSLLVTANIPNPNTPLYHAPTSTTQNSDTLYCEVCNGIPVDEYKRMHPPPPSSDLFPYNDPVLRRCLGLSRSLIATALSLPAIHVEPLLASVFPVPQHRPHDLRCGHRVWHEAAKRCPSNCVGHGHDAVGGCAREGRWSHVIMCAECVLRADLVYRRYASMEAALAGAG